MGDASRDPRKRAIDVVHTSNPKERMRLEGGRKDAEHEELTTLMAMFDATATVLADDFEVGSQDGPWTEIVHDGGPNGDTMAGPTQAKVEIGAEEEQPPEAHQEEQHTATWQERAWYAAKQEPAEDEEEMAPAVDEEENQYATAMLTLIYTYPPLEHYHHYQ